MLPHLGGFLLRQSRSRAGSSVIIPEAPQAMARDISYQVLQTQQNVIMPRFRKCQTRGRKSWLISFKEVKNSLVLRVSPHYRFFQSWKCCVQRGICRIFAQISMKGSHPVKQASAILATSQSLANVLILGSAFLSCPCILPLMPRTVIQWREWRSRRVTSCRMACYEGVLSSIFIGTVGNLLKTYRRVGMLSPRRLVTLPSSANCTSTSSLNPGSSPKSYSFTCPRTPQLRSRSKSWCTTSSPSLVSHTSISSMSLVPKLHSKDSTVFSTLCRGDPRCATTQIPPPAKGDCGGTLRLSGGRQKERRLAARQPAARILRGRASMANCTLKYILVIKVGMSGSSKRGWSKEEDQELQELVHGQPAERLRWVEVALQLRQQYARNRTGKQCRERWQHQLDPAILRQQWSPHEQTALFSLQAVLGNKWALIAQELPGRTDNAVKNYFYSYLRRILTRLNAYLLHQKHRREFRNMREFEADFLSKLMAVVDGSHARKMRLTGEDTSGKAKTLLPELLALGSEEGSRRLESSQVDQAIDGLLRKMHSFRKNCKKRKQKRRDEDAQPPDSPSHSSSIHSLPTPERHSYPQAKADALLAHLPTACRNHLQKSEQKSENQDLQNSLGRGRELEMEGVEGVEGVEVEVESRSLVRMKEDGWSVAEGFPSLCCLGQDEWWELKEEKEESELVPLFRQKQLQVEGSGPHCPHSVSKIKMLQASVALEECLLRAKSHSPQQLPSPPQP